MLPLFKELPFRKGDPLHSAWGLYGPNDQLGTLNLLTEDVVAKAAKLIKTGKRIPLNWEVTSPAHPFFQRRKTDHKVFQLAPRTINDDEIHMNTQASTQIDGLRHYAYQNEKLFYNGVTEEQILEKGSTVLGVHHMSQAGIVGRGVLIDYLRWADENGKKFNPTSQYHITLSELLDAAKSQGVEKFEKGDILIIRSGYIKAILDMSDETLQKYASHSEGPCAIGVEQSDDMLAFLWDNHFSMVAGDAIAFECRPPVEGRTRLHEYLLAGWGMPIGELWYLENLSEYCAKHKRYTFFLTSSPVNAIGGVGTPANAIAVF